MTIDEAIEHCKEVAGNGNCKCALEHKQLAEWLEKAKASQWHYPSKGEYPPKEQEYFVAFKTDKEIYCDVRVLNPDLNNLLLACGEQIYAWQNIVPPKEL